jgi:hypothetical protein
MISQSEDRVIIDGIQITPYFNWIELLSAISSKTTKTCNCCALADVYNGLGSGPLLFICPKGCSCHD